jgi:hypothetical protein
MPLVGVLAGHTLGALTGSLSEWLAAAVLIGVGVWFLVRRDEGEEKRASRLLSANPLMAAALGVSISLDELAIGFQPRAEQPAPGPGSHRDRDSDRRGESAGARARCADPGAGAGGSGAAGRCGIRGTWPVPDCRARGMTFVPRTAAGRSCEMGA